MKNFFKIVYALIFLVISAQYSSAIEWVKITTPKGKIAYVDKDSILKTEKYYFYNIKYQDRPNTSYKILTVQSGLSNPYSARLKLYKEDEYEQLNGDYDNITNLMTKNLEAPEFGSIINCCHKKVKEILEEKNIPNITLE